MKLSKFTTLYNKILFENNITNIKYNTFDYKFQQSDNDPNKLFCMFDSIDKYDNKLIHIKVTIFENNLYEFEVTKNNKSKTYTDKEFLLSYYKDYQDFKKVLSLYKKENTQNVNNIKKDNENIIDGKVMPKITSFNDALTQVNDNKDRYFNKNRWNSVYYKTSS